VRSSPVRDLLALVASSDVISLAGGLPAPELFDRDGLARAFATVLEPGRAAQTLQYSTTEGDPRLREQLATLMRDRGVPTDADDVVVTSGSQQALTLTSAVLLEPGDAVLVENPSYLAALQAFTLAGARLIPVPTDDDGLKPEAIGELAAAHGARLVYSIPTFQNPTGRTLSLERRRALARELAANDLWLLEDDPYGELRFEGEALPAVASLSGAQERTILLSSLSKTVAPGLRIGWGRVPATLRPAFVVAKQAHDLHTSTIDQAAAAEHLASTDLEAHLERSRATYRARRDAMLAGLPGALPDGSRWTRPAGGMFIWVRLPDGHDAEALLPRALEEGVAFVPGTSFFAGKADPGALRLAFSEPAPERIAEALERLGRALGR
jgi:2-aminoadipate transaminase